jgi:hypothetical protein
MTTTEIRDVLHSVGHTVEVPSPDPAAFEARVRRVRTRRTASRAGGAALVLATVVAGTIGFASWTSGGAKDTPPAVDDPNVVQDFSWDGRQLMLVMDGRLMVTAADDAGAVRDTGVAVSELLQTDGPFATVVTPDGDVRVLVLDGSGHVVSGDDDLQGSVRQAWAPHDGSAFAFVGESGDTVLRVAGDDQPSLLVPGVTPEVAALDMYGGGNVVFAWAEGRRLSVRTPEGDVRTGEAFFDITDIDIAGATMAVQTDDGVEIHELDGKLRHGSLGGRVGALSTDGHWYASGSTQRNLDEGMTRGLWLVNATQGTVEDFPLGGTGPVTDVWWQDQDRFLVQVAEDGSTLYDCSVSAYACRAVLSSRTRTIELPQD